MGMEDREWLFEALQQQLRNEWEELRDIRHNSKGNEYEKKLVKILEQYFGSLYDIRQRAALVDPDGICFDEFDFTSGEEEIDVVGSFRQANPRIVFETGEEPDTLPWVPYEGVAFVCEVKSQLDKQALDKDLFKLNKVRKLNQSIENRFGPKIGAEYTIDMPLRILVYDVASISDSTLNRALKKQIDEWHIVLIVEEDTIILNRELPISDKAAPSKEKFGPPGLDGLPDEQLQYIEQTTGFEVDSELITLDNGLIWFIISLSTSIPDPLSVSTANSLLSLFEGTNVSSEAKTSLESMNLSE